MPTKQPLPISFLLMQSQVCLFSTSSSEQARRADSIPISAGNTKLIPEVISSTVIGSPWAWYADRSNVTLKRFQPMLWKIRPQTKNLELDLIVY